MSQVVDFYGNNYLCICTVRTSCVNLWFGIPTLAFSEIILAITLCSLILFFHVKHFLEERFTIFIYGWMDVGFSGNQTRDGYIQFGRLATELLGRPAYKNILSQLFICPLTKLLENIQNLHCIICSKWVKSGLTAHQRGHTETGHQFKVSYERS